MSSEYICGVNAVLEALRAGKRRVFEVYIVPGKRHSTIKQISSQASKSGVPIREASRQQIHEMSRVEKNQGVAARVEPFSYNRLESIINNAKEGDFVGFIVLLDEILDPQNVGSLIRTAHLCGASGVIIPKDRAAGIGPAATRAAAGATEYLPIAQVTNVAKVLDELKEEGFWVVGAEGDSAQALYGYDFTSHLHVVVMGGEGKGIRRLVREKCDTLLAIPMEGKIGSYNVSVAGAIFMSEVSRQRWKKTHAKIVPFKGEMA